MKLALMLIILAFCLISCKSGDDANNSAVSNIASATSAKGALSKSGSGGVAPMASGAAGGLTPISGTDSVEGAGAGSVGAAAKQMAKDKAGKMGNGSMDQMPKEDSGQ